MDWLTVLKRGLGGSYLFILAFHIKVAEKYVENWVRHNVTSILASWQLICFTRHETKQISDYKKILYIRLSRVIYK